MLDTNKANKEVKMLFKNKLFVGVFLCVFILLLCITIFVGFGSELESSGIVINSITPLYDEESTVVVNDDGVIFNDKDQEVKYKVVIENTKNYDVRVTDIELTTPTEDFLEYKIDGIDKDDIVGANSTKEVVVSFSTVRKEGWGRNFEDELTANISFVKVVKQEEQKPTPKPDEEKKEEIKVEKKPVVEEQPKEDTIVDVVAPAKDSTELKENFNLIEDYEIEENVIVFNNIQNVVDKQKIDVWIYSDPIYLGRFEVEVKDGKTKIIGLSEALEKNGIEEGNHSLVLQSEAGEKIGYIEVKIDNKKFVKPVQEVIPDDDLSNKIEDNDKKKEESKEDKKENKGNVLGIVLVVVTGVTGTAIVVILVVNKKKKTLATLVVLLAGISLVKADELIELPITFNVSFESQNVMKPSGWSSNNEGEVESIGVDYWFYASQIVDIYINNDIEEISDYDYEFDVSDSQNGRVMAYLVKRDDDFVCMDLDGNEAFCYNLYLQSDGIIYANEDSSFYFGLMAFLNSINNIEGLDTSQVTNMSFMFVETGVAHENFVLDLGDNFDTSNVTNMRGMFASTGCNSTDFILDLGDKFDTSNVTNMSHMFFSTGESSADFTLDLGDKFDTSQVTNMSNMFSWAGSGSSNFTLDLGDKFDTSKVTDMGYMFGWAGSESSNFTLDLGDKFDTSNVTDMSFMFSFVGSKSSNFTLDLGDKFDTSKVTDMSNMFLFCESMKTSITIKNPDVKLYDSMFMDAATKEGSEIMVNYTDGTSELVDKMIATKSTGSNVVKGKLVVDVDNLDVGDEIHIRGEKFNVISQTEDKITMLAKYSLNSSYKQSTNYVRNVFGNGYGWEYAPIPQNIDVQKWSTIPKQYINEYVAYLKTLTGDNNITGDLISLEILKDLDCDINFTLDGSLSCENTKYKSWLINDQYWWTKTAGFDSPRTVFLVGRTGILYNSVSDSDNVGVRPVITISKESLKNYLEG